MTLWCCLGYRSHVSLFFFFFSSRRRHTRFDCDWSSDVCSSDLEKCVEVGGTITGEHGVGVEKINQMCVQFATAEIERFQGVKRAFDPEGLLNPGKNIPTLHRCAEFGRMRVRGGQLPHPELPRF